MMNKLNNKRAHIDKLTREFDKLWTGYEFQLLGVARILALDLDRFNTEQFNLNVDEKGHCWMVPTATNLTTN